MLLSISWHERKKTTIVQWSVVNNFSLVIITLHRQGKGQESCVRSNLDYYQAIFSTAFTLDWLLEKPPYLNVEVVTKRVLRYGAQFTTWSNEGSFVYLKTHVTSIQVMIKWSRKRYNWCCGVFLQELDVWQQEW